MGPYSRPNVSQSYVFECSDGGWIALHMSSPVKFWEALAEAVGRPDMLSLAQFADRAARIENYEAVVAFLAPIFATRPREAWRLRLRDHGVPSSPVYASDEVLATDQIRHLGVEIETEGPMGRFRTIRSPVSFDGEAAREVTAPPLLGADNEAILGRSLAERAAE